MGFFKDFKRDFAQAVNELMPDKDELSAEYDDEDMVNTFDDNDNMDIAPEDMMEDLDDYTIDDRHIVDPKAEEKLYEMERPDTDYDEDEKPKEESVFDTGPSAEIISDSTMSDMEQQENSDFAQDIISEFINPEVVSTETIAVDLEAEKTKEDSQLDELEDELKNLEDLDEDNMLENTQEALAVDYTEEMPQVSEEYLNVDLSKAVEAAILKNEEENDVAAPVGDDAEEEDTMVLDGKSQNESSSKEQEINSVLTDDTTYITKGTTIKGNIETDGSVDVIGTVEGNLSCGGKLIVGGTIKGNVTAGEVYANAAKVEGELICDGSVKIGVGTVIVGNVNATSAVIAGAVNGDIDVHGPVIVDSTAVIMGNIKSRSVQINNGAVIEGFCSQCYSEIDVKSFFE